MVLFSHLGSIRYPMLAKLQIQDLAEERRVLNRKIGWARLNFYQVGLTVGKRLPLPQSIRTLPFLAGLPVDVSI